MKFQICSHYQKTENNFTIKVRIKLPDGIEWCGIHFLARDSDRPDGGYLFIMSRDGFITLYQGNEEEPVELAKKRLGFIDRENWYWMTITKIKDIFSFYLETDENPLEPWPVLEFPLPEAHGKYAAIAVNENAIHQTSETNEFYSNFKISGAKTEIDDLSIPMYQNPVLNGYADPDILYYEGTYYLYATSPNQEIGYRAYTSKDLVNWTDSGMVMGEAWGFKKGYWAPDIKYKDKKFYMLVTAEEHIGIAVADSPLGPFITEKTFLHDKSIDGHIFIDDDGKVYIYYVSWREGKEYALYAMQMEKDCVTPVLSTETLVIKASDHWEKQKAPVAEAPYILKHKEKYYLTYSGSHFESIAYAIGYAIADHPLGPFKKYEGNPILSYNYMAHGPGHHCFTKSPDGKEMFIVYHTHHNVTEVQPRNLNIDRVRFVSEEGKDDRLVIYGPTVTKQPYPSQKFNI